MPDEPESILSQVPPSTWDSKDSINFEVALEILGHAIAAYNALTVREEAKGNPDQHQIAEWQRLQTDAEQMQDTLSRHDTAAIEHIIREYGQQVRDLMRALHA